MINGGTIVSIGAGGGVGFISRGGSRPAASSFLTETRSFSTGWYRKCNPMSYASAIPNAGGVNDVGSSR
jgi:hypothetical protein